MITLNSHLVRVQVEGDPTSQFPSKYRNYSQATELKQLLRTESPELCYEWAKVCFFPIETTNINDSNSRDIGEH